LRARAVEELAGERVSRQRLRAFWQRYPAAQERQLEALRALDSSPPATAGDLFDRLERNLVGYRAIARALASGSGGAFGTRTFNSELDAQRLAEQAGLSSCGPADRTRPTAYGASLVERAADDP
jgi:hypothetical protein